MVHDQLQEQTTKVENRTEKMGVKEKRYECMRKYESNLEIIRAEEKRKDGTSRKEPQLKNDKNIKRRAKADEKRQAMRQYYERKI